MLEKIFITPCMWNSRETLCAKISIFSWKVNTPHCPQQYKNLIKVWGDGCFNQDGLLWSWWTSNNYQAEMLLFCQHLFEIKIIEAAHGQLLSGHMGLSKTRQRICQSYNWPNMDADISKQIDKFTPCQERRFQYLERSEKLTPLPLCTEPNQRVHIDLFGPLIPTQAKKWTCAWWMLSKNTLK